MFRPTFSALVKNVETIVFNPAAEFNRKSAIFFMPPPEISGGMGKIPPFWGLLMGSLDEAGESTLQPWG
jgi:hypothetical protein